jgi:hypothetical protein
MAAFASRKRQISQQFYDKVIAATHNVHFGFFPRQLPICVATGLEPDHSARKVGISPVGADH